MAPNRRNSMYQQFMNVKIVFFDEVSLLGGSAHDAIDQRLRDCFDKQHVPFGGIHMVFFGDLHQLRPVYDRWIFEDATHQRKDASALAPNLWRAHVKAFELTQIMRQGDEREFINILNNIRVGKVLIEDIHTLHTKSGNLTRADLRRLPHFFQDNKSVDNHNNLVYESLPGPEVHILADDTSLHGMHQGALQKLRENIRSDEDTYNITVTGGMKTVLKLKKGMNVCLTSNVLVEDGLFNGAAGIVQSWYIPGAGQGITVTPRGLVWVKFTNATTGSNWRRKHSEIIKTAKVPETWTPIFPFARPWETNFKHIKNRDKLLRLQFPLLQSDAMTINKAQGMSVNEGVVDLSKAPKRIGGLHYTAMSRFRSLKGMHIKNLDLDRVHVDPLVVNEIKRLKKRAMVDLQITPAALLGNQGFVIMAHNANSMHAHMLDVRANHDYKHVLAVLHFETFAAVADSNEYYNLHGMSIVRNDAIESTNGRRQRGSMLHHKFNLEHKVLHNNEGIEITGGYICCDGQQGCPLLIIGVYKAPKSKLSLLIDALEHILHDPTLPTIIMGDFNEDARRMPACITTCLEKHNLRNIPIGQSHVKGGHIDHVWTNIYNLQAGMSCAYYSDHWPIWVTVPKVVQIQCLR